MDKPKDGASRTTDQSPRWEGPQENTPPASLLAKDDPNRSNRETYSDPEVKKVSDGSKHKGLTCQASKRMPKDTSRRVSSKPEVDRCHSARDTLGHQLQLRRQKSGVEAAP